MLANAPHVAIVRHVCRRAAGYKYGYNAGWPILKPDGIIVEENNKFDSISGDGETHTV